MLQGKGKMLQLGPDLPVVEDRQAEGLALGVGAQIRLKCLARF